MVLKFLLFRNGYIADGYGGAIFKTEGTISLIMCAFKDNETGSGGGGAVGNYNGEIKLYGTELSGNSAPHGTSDVY